jgi:hypothetical protein
LDFVAIDGKLGNNVGHGMSGGRGEGKKTDGQSEKSTSVIHDWSLLKKQRLFNCSYAKNPFFCSLLQGRFANHPRGCTPLVIK